RRHEPDHQTPLQNEESMSSSTVRRYAVVGTGHRAEMYVRALLDSHADVGTPVAWCDTNAVRMRYYDRVFQAYDTAAPLPSSWPAEDFDDMLTSVRPDEIGRAHV